MVSLGIVAIGLATATGPAEARGDGPLYVVAGGEAETAGRGAVATRLRLEQPYFIGGPAALADGSFLLPDDAGNRVLRITTDGRWSAVAGIGGEWTFGGDGGPARMARLARPAAVAALAVGGFVVSDSLNNRVRRVGADGVITTAAGNGAEEGDSGDGGPAVMADLPDPGALAALPDGGFLVASSGRVRRVLPNGTIVAFAGDGRPGFSGDGGPAIRARLTPDALSVAPDGSVLIGTERRVRRVAPDGTISTVAGNGSATSSGDGGRAVRAGITEVSDVHARADGSFLIADPQARRIRKVDPAGMISTLIGPSAFRDFAGRETYGGGYSSIPTAVTTVSDGMLLQGPTGVLYAPSTRSLRPAIRIGGARVRGTRVGLAVSATMAGTVTVRVVRRGRTIATGRAQQVAPARQRLDLTPGVRAGVYTVRARLKAGTGVATDEATLVLGRRLTKRLAQDVLGLFARGDGISYFESVPRRCRRFSWRRVDCVIANWGSPGPVRCSYVAAVVLGRDGVMRERPYDCPRRGRPTFRRGPGERGTGSVLPIQWL